VPDKRHSRANHKSWIVQNYALFSVSHIIVAATPHRCSQEMRTRLEPRVNEIRSLRMEVRGWRRLEKHQAVQTGADRAQNSALAGKTRMIRTAAAMLKQSFAVNGT